ncbi:MAG: dihydroorotate dehydrogenase [Chloroflexi bacterium]|nr:dihydroorotate dehydrogenase [Chloroflexota bacterium]
MGVSLAVEICAREHARLELKNPVMTAAGTFGYGTEYAKLVDIEQLGAIVSKGVTLYPREGNPQPRIVETPAGMLNTIGLQNIGVEAVVCEKAPVWARWKVPVILNIAGESVDDYVRIAEAVEGVPGIAALELNISCPNVQAGGMSFGVDRSLAAEVTSAVRAATALPIIPKLTPNVGDIVEIARAVADAGADAVSLINTLKGMIIDLKTRRPFLSTKTGGLSGPAIRPVALRMVYEVAREIDVPVIGMGGIASAEDALQFIMAGAAAVQVGTASFSDPRAALGIISGIEDFLNREGISDLSELVGVAQ